MRSKCSATVPARMVRTRHGEIPVGTADAQTITSQLRGAARSHQKGDVSSRPLQAATKISAKCTRSDHQNAHEDYLPGLTPHTTGHLQPVKITVQGYSGNNHNTTALANYGTDPLPDEALEHAEE